MDNVDNCNAKLNASSGGGRDLSLGMVCHVPWPPSTSVEQENDAGGTEVKCKVREVVRGMVCLYLLERKRSNVV